MMMRSGVANASRDARRRRRRPPDGPPSPPSSSSASVAPSAPLSSSSSNPALPSSSGTIPATFYAGSAGVTSRDTSGAPGLSSSSARGFADSDRDVENRSESPIAALDRHGVNMSDAASIASSSTFVSSSTSGRKGRKAATLSSSGPVFAKEVLVMVDSFEASEAACRALVQIRYLNEPCTAVDQEKNMRLLSVTLADGTVMHHIASRTAVPIIVKSTRFCFVYRRYHVVFAIDATSSMYTVALLGSLRRPEPVYALPGAQVVPILSVMLQALLHPIPLMTNGTVLRPCIKVSVVVRSSIKEVTSGSATLVSAALLTADSIPDIMAKTRRGLQMLTRPVIANSPNGNGNIAINAGIGGNMGNEPRRHLRTSSSTSSVSISSGVQPTSRPRVHGSLDSVDTMESLGPVSYRDALEAGPGGFESPIASGFSRRHGIDRMHAMPSLSLTNASSSHANLESKRDPFDVSDDEYDDGEPPKQVSLLEFLADAIAAVQLLEPTACPCVVVVSDGALPSRQTLHDESCNPGLAELRRLDIPVHFSLITSVERISSAFGTLPDLSELHFVAAQAGGVCLDMNFLRCIREELANQQQADPSVPNPPSRAARRELRRLRRKTKSRSASGMNVVFSEGVAEELSVSSAQKLLSTVNTGKFVVALLCRFNQLDDTQTVSQSGASGPRTAASAASSRTHGSNPMTSTASSSGLGRRRFSFSANSVSSGLGRPTATHRVPLQHSQTQTVRGAEGLMSLFDHDLPSPVLDRNQQAIHSASAMTVNPMLASSSNGATSTSDYNDKPAASRLVHQVSSSASTPPPEPVPLGKGPFKDSAALRAQTDSPETIAASTDGHQSTVTADSNQIGAHTSSLGPSGVLGPTLGEQRRDSSIMNVTLVPFFSSETFQPALEPRSQRLQTSRALKAIAHPFPWVGKPPASPVIVREILEYRMTGLRPTEVFSCRLKDGFLIKQAIYDNHVLCVRFALNYTPHITIIYILKVARGMDNSHRVAVVNLRLVASDCFHKRFSELRNRLEGALTEVDRQYASDSLELRLHHFVNSLIEGDRALVYIAASLRDPKQGSRALLESFALEPLSRWHRWFHVNSFDILLTPPCVMSYIVENVLMKWATFIIRSPSQEGGIVHMSKIVPPDSLSPEGMQQNGHVEKLAPTAQPYVILCRFVPLSDFLASVHVAFPMATSWQLRQDLLAELVRSFDQAMPGHIRHSRQGHRSFAELCRVAVPPVPTQSAQRGLILSTTRMLLSNFLLIQPRAWPVPNLATTHHVARALFRARMREGFAVTSCSFPLSRSEKGQLDITHDTASASLEQNGYVSFCKSIPVFDPQESRGVRETCLLQYRILFNSGFQIRTEVILENTNVMFKPQDGPVMHAEELQLSLRDHFDQVDSFFVSTSIAFVAIKECTSADIPTFQGKLLAKTESGSNENPQNLHDVDIWNLQCVEVQDGVQSLLQFSPPSIESFEVFRAKNRTIANEEYFNLMVASLAAISDVRLLDAAHIQDRSNLSGPTQKNLYFAKVLSPERILVVSVPALMSQAFEKGPTPAEVARNPIYAHQSPRSHSPTETKEDDGWEKRAFEMSFYEVNYRNLFYPGELVREELKTNLNYRAPVKGSSVDLGIEEVASSALDSAEAQSFLKQVREAHFYNMVLTIHRIFGARDITEEERPEVLHTGDIETILRKCRFTTGSVNASLLRAILSATLRQVVPVQASDVMLPDGAPPSPEQTLSEVDARFDSILNEFFEPISNTSFYILEPEKAAILLASDDVDHGEDEDEEENPDRDGRQQAQQQQNHQQQPPLHQQNQQQNQQRSRGLRGFSSEDEGDLRGSLKPNTDSSSRASESGSARDLPSTTLPIAQDPSLIPPFFFRICCTSQPPKPLASASELDSEPKNIMEQADSAPTEYTFEIEKGRICETIMATSRSSLASKVLINLIFCTLPPHPKPVRSGQVNSQIYSQDAHIVAASVWKNIAAELQKKVKSRVQAMVSSAVLTSLQRVYPVTERNVLLVQQLLNRGSLPIKDITRLSIPLRFVDTDMGVKLFAKTLGQTPYLSLRRVGTTDTYFVVEPLVADSPLPKEKTPSDPTPSKINLGPPTSTSNSFLFAQTGVRRWSASSLGDVQGKVGTKSLSIAAPTTSLRSEWNTREYVVPYWAIFTAAGPSVTLEFHHPGLHDDGRAQVIVESLRRGILQTVDRVNRLILLHQLHDSRWASPLLIKPDPATQNPKELDSARNRGILGRRSQDPQAQRNSTGFVNRQRFSTSKPVYIAAAEMDVWDPQNLPDGTFACQCFHRERFEVPERLHINVAMNEVRQSLSMFSVANHKNTYVYQYAGTGQIFILKLRQEGSDSDVNLGLTMRQRSRRGSTMATEASFTSSAASVASSASNPNQAIILEVYGVDLPPEVMLKDLREMLESKLSNSTLSALTLLLRRYLTFKIQPYDLYFLQGGKHPVPTLRKELIIPQSIGDIALLLFFFKQNLLRFTTACNFASPPDLTMYKYSEDSDMESISESEHSLVHDEDDNTTYGAMTPQQSFERPDVAEHASYNRSTMHPAMSGWNHSDARNVDSDAPAIVDVEQIHPVFAGFQDLIDLEQADPSEAGAATEQDPSLRTLDLRTGELAFVFNSVPPEKGPAPPTPSAVGSGMSSSSLGSSGSNSNVQSGLTALPLELSQSEIGSGIAFSLLHLLRNGKQLFSVETRDDSFSAGSRLPSPPTVGLPSQQGTAPLPAGGSAPDVSVAGSASAGSAPAAKGLVRYSSQRTVDGETQTSALDAGQRDTIPPRGAQHHRRGSSTSSLPLPYTEMTSDVPRATARRRDLDLRQVGQGPPPTFSIVIDMWQKGQVILEKLEQCFEAAFQQSLSEYEFEVQRLERPLRLTIPSETGESAISTEDILPFASRHGASSIVLEQKERPGTASKRNLKKTQSRAFDSIQLDLRPGIFPWEKQLLLNELSHMVAFIQPDLCHLAFVEDAANSRVKPVALAKGASSVPPEAPASAGAAHPSRNVRSSDILPQHDEAASPDSEPGNVSRYKSSEKQNEATHAFRNMYDRNAAKKDKAVDFVASQERFFLLAADHFNIEVLDEQNRLQGKPELDSVALPPCGSNEDQIHILGLAQSSLETCVRGGNFLVGDPRTGNEVQIRGASSGFVRNEGLYWQHGTFRRDTGSSGKGTGGSHQPLSSRSGSSVSAQTDLSSVSATTGTNSYMTNTNNSTNNPGLPSSSSTGDLSVVGSSSSEDQSKWMKKRSCCISVVVSNESVRIHFYNWNPSYRARLERGLTFLVSWVSVRGNLLRSIFHQRMGLFSHAVLPASLVRYLIDVDRALRTRDLEKVGTETNTIPEAGHVSLSVTELNVLLRNKVPPSIVLKPLIRETDNRLKSKSTPDGSLLPMKSGRGQHMSLSAMNAVRASRNAMQSRRRASNLSTTKFMHAMLGSKPPGPLSSAASTVGSISGATAPTLDSNSIRSVSPSVCVETPLTKLTASDTYGSSKFLRLPRGTRLRTSFEVQLRGTAPGHALESSMQSSEDQVERLGEQLLDNAHERAMERQRKTMIKSLVGRWRQQWIGQASLASSRFPFSGLEDGFQDEEDAIEYCLASPAEVSLLLDVSRVLHTVRTPIYFSEHPHTRTQAVAEFARVAVEDMVHVYVHYLVHQLGMRHVVMSESLNAHGASQRSMQGGHFSAGSSEAYAQRQLNGAVVIIQVHVYNGVFKVLMRLIEPDLHDEADIAGVSTTTPDDLFMINTSASARSRGPYFTQELGRIRSALGVRWVIYDFQIYLFKRTLQRISERPVGVACQVFAFARQFPNPPMGAQSALMHHEFQFLLGVPLAKADVRDVFQYVVRKADRYGMVGIRPSKPGGNKTYLYLTSDDGTFTNPFHKRKTGFTYAVLIAVKEDDEDDTASRPDTLTPDLHTSGRNGTDGSINLDNVSNQTVSISFEVCLIASNDDEMRRILETEETGPDVRRASIESGLHGGRERATSPTVGSVGSTEDDEVDDDDDDDDEDDFEKLRAEQTGDSSMDFGDNDSEHHFDPFSSFTFSRKGSIATQDEDNGDDKGKTNVVCGMEEALDNMDVFLHKVFSHAVLRFRRKLLWKRLRMTPRQCAEPRQNTESSSQPTSSSEIVATNPHNPSTATPTRTSTSSDSTQQVQANLPPRSGEEPVVTRRVNVNIEDLEKLSFSCALSDVDEDIAEMLPEIPSSNLIEFLSFAHGPLALRGEGDRLKTDIVLLPPPQLDFIFVVHVTVPAFGPPIYRLRFPKPIVSQHRLEDAQIFLTTVMQTLLAKLWDGILAF